MVQLQFPRPPRRAFRLGLHLAGVAALCSLFSCSDSSSDGRPSGGGGGGGGTGPGTPREKAARVNNFLINYGSWDDASIDVARRYDVVVVHPSQGVTRDIVERIQKGVDPGNSGDDVVVLGYVSIGEDLR